MKVIQLLEFTDNFLYFLVDETTKEATVVDPGDAFLVKDFLQQKGLKLKSILVTHHHRDHIGGVDELVKIFSPKVYGNPNDSRRIPWITHPVCGGDSFLLFGHEVNVQSGDGHTVGHVMYHFLEDEMLFCGDVLFSLGCGKLFEGTPQQMWEALSWLMALPTGTKVYCSHEYTLENAEFAKRVEPSNDELKRRIAEVKKLMQEGRFSIPTTVGLELKTNPFLRVDSQEIQQILGFKNSITKAEKFGSIRRAKDQFDSSGKI